MLLYCIINSNKFNYLGFGFVIQWLNISGQQEILGGILDVDPQRWRKPRRENFDQQRKKVLDFAAMWKPYDFTSKLRDE